MLDKLYYYRINLERVIDGDTIVASIDLGFYIYMNSKSIRLSRVDAPEVRGKGKEVGIEIKETLQSFLIGKNLLLWSKELESFGRVLGEVYYQDESNNWLSLGDWLINLDDVYSYVK